MQAEDTTCDQDIACAVIIPFPGPFPGPFPRPFPGPARVKEASLVSRILSSFAFAAGCLYPEFAAPLIALNETVACPPRWSRGTPPEKEIA